MTLRRRKPLQEVPPTIQMLEFTTAPYLSACVYLATKRGFADIIEAAGNHQASVEHIAQESKVHPVWTRAILQVLVKIHIFTETEQHLFKNTPLSDCLRRDHPQTLKWLVSVALSPRSIIQLSQLDSSIHEVGISIPKKLWGEELYELFEKQDEGQSIRLSPERVIIEREPRAEFDMMLESVETAIVDNAIAQTYQFKGSVCDLGGGRGSLLAAIYRHHPHVEGILFERKPIIDALKRQQSEHPFSLVCGDFFRQVPYADIYILKHVFHNWPDDSCTEILKRCAEGNPDAKVLVIEEVIGNPMGFSELANLVMMIEQNGKERTVEEYKEISKSGGFTQMQVYAMQPSQMIFELTR
jgi:hypothetical protein